jgi:predicted porin
MEVVPRKRRPYSTLEKIEMKKTLVAIAALASVSAFAQVTITGNLDFAGARVGGTALGQKGTTFSTSTGASSTSAINIAATEDLGGGMKATAFWGLDIRTLSNDGMAVTTNQGSATTDANTTTLTGINRHEAYVQLSSEMGTLRLGAPNSIGLGVQGDSSPNGTGIGSGFGGIAANTMVNSVVQIRYNRSLRYDTPTINGITGSFIYAPGNDQAEVLASASTTNNSALQIPNNRRANEVGLKYVNGPLTISAVQVMQAYQTNRTGFYAVDAAGTGTLGSLATRSNLFAANYKFGNTQLYVGAGTGSANTSTTSLTAVNMSRWGIKHSIGALDIMPQYTRVKTTTATGVTTLPTVVGLQVAYNLSKTSAAYLGYENFNTGTAVQTTGTTSGTRSITSVGLRKSF